MVNSTEGASSAMMVVVGFRLLSDVSASDKWNKKRSKINTDHSYR